MTVPDVAEENKESGSRSIYYHAEFYDLYTSKYLIDPTDTKVYFDQLRAIHNPAVVLDIATGTGRIIQGLIEHGDRLGHNWNQTTLIGLDNSESMIDSARKSIAAPKAGNLTWMLGSAFDLRSALAAMQLPIYAIDLLILSFGTISHFIAEGQCQHFFNEIGKILRPGGGAQLYPSFVTSRKSEIQSGFPAQMILAGFPASNILASPIRRCCCKALPLITYIRTVV